MTETPAPATPLTLQAGALRLALRPDLGGCIAGLWLDDEPVLRSTAPEDLASSRASGCYPLAPYSNRIGYARFRWHGQDHRTVPNFDDSPHSVHGVAWQRPWAVLVADATQAELAYVHAADAHWPFAFTLRQRCVLTPEALELHLVLRNDAPLHAPAGLGWHPYFPRRQRSRLHAEVARRWDSDAAGLPTRAVPQPGLDGDVAHMAFDHCFDGWQGAARLRDEKLSLRLSSSLPCLVVYTPQTKPYWCVEPVSHVSNAIHMSDPAAHGLRTLAPGASMDAWMRLDVGRP
jgi:aldose 1-epimerase